LACFQAFLFRYTNLEDIAIGSSMSCRNEPGVEHVVGPFANNVIFRTNFKTNPSFLNFVNSVRQSLMGVRANSEYPFALLLQKLKATVDSSSPLSDGKLFNIMFDFEYPESSQASQLQGATLGLVASVAIGSQVCCRLFFFVKVRLYLFLSLRRAQRLSSVVC
jgi:non-ribosomal peptide synthetase component F